MILRNNDCQLFVTEGADIDAYYTRLEHLKLLNPAHEATIDSLAGTIRISFETEMRKIYKSKLEDARSVEYKAGLSTKSKEDINKLSDSTPLPDFSKINGKKYLAKLRQEFQTSTKSNLVVEQQSTFLRDQNLLSILGIKA